MGLLSSRYLFNADNSSHFHSSRMVNGESVTGSANAQSFEQRQHVEAHRQSINSYRDAGVIHTYRREATTPGDAPRVGYTRTNTIDTAKTSRMRFLPSQHAGHQPTQFAREKPTFDEPPLRKYNPYSSG